MTDSQVVTVLQRIRKNPSGALEDLVTRTLRDIDAQLGFGPDQIRRLWDHVVAACEGGAATALHDDADRVGERAANAGWLFNDCMNCLQRLRHLAMEALRMEALDGGFGTAVVVQGFQRIAEAMTGYLLEFSNGYFRAEIVSQLRVRSQQDSFVWNVLTGGMDVGESYNRMSSYGLDPSGSYWAFRVPEVTDADLTAFEAMLGKLGHGSGRVGVSTVIGRDLCGFSGTVPDATLSEPIGVSGPVPISALPAAFRRATRAAHVARLAQQTGVQTLEGLGILASVMTDRDVAAVLDEKFLQPFRDLGEYGESIIDTVRSYIACDGQADVAAKELGIHVNSVRYRLSKFEDTIGINLRETRRLAEVWWALQLPEGIPDTVPEPESLIDQ